MNKEEHITKQYNLSDVDCHKGWFDLLKPLFEYVEKYNKDKEEDKQIKFIQIKEKWSLLDVYTNFTTEELDYLIEEAKEKAKHTCEECGSVNDVGTKLNGWVCKMCLDCVKKEAANQNYPQLWERYSDNKRFWIFPSGSVEKIEQIEENEENMEVFPKNFWLI